MKYLSYILHRLAFVACTETGRIKPVYSGMPLVYRYKASAFPFSCIHWQRVLFRKAWFRDLSSIHEYFWMYENSKCLIWQLQTIFFSWLVLVCNAFYFNSAYNCIAHITFYTQSKRLLLTIIHCSLYTRSNFVLGRSAAWMAPGPSQPPTPSCILYIDVLGSYRSSTL